MDTIYSLINSERPLFTISAPPKKSPEIVAVIDGINRDVLEELGIPTGVAEEMVLAMRDETVFFSFQNPDDVLDFRFDTV